MLVGAEIRSHAETCRSVARAYGFEESTVELGWRGFRSRGKDFQYNIVGEREICSVWDGFYHLPKFNLGRSVSLVYIHISRSKLHANQNASQRTTTFGSS